MADALGFKWRERKDGRAAYWLASPAKIRQGFRPKSVRLYSGPTPDGEVIAACRERARQLNAAMQAWQPEAKSRPARQGLIYFLAIGDHIKIGFTTDLDRRTKELSTGSPVRGTLLGTLPGSREIDRFVRWLFRASHQQGDWFVRSDPLLAFIAEHATVAHPKRRLRGERKPKWRGTPEECPKKA